MSIAIALISIGIAFFGTILIPAFRNRYQMRKELQDKISLLNFIEADITVLGEVHSDLARVTPLSQILDKVEKKIIEVPDLPIKKALSEFIASLKENKHLLINMHSNFFVGFDNYICKEIGNLSSDISEKVIKFYDYAKTFCDTSRNYIESLKVLENENYIEALEKLGIDINTYYEDLKNHLQSLKNLYEKAEEERKSILPALREEKGKLERKKSEISKLTNLWHAFKISF